MAALSPGGIITHKQPANQCSYNNSYTHTDMRAFTRQAVDVLSIPITQKGVKCFMAPLHFVMTEHSDRTEAFPQIMAYL